MPATLTGPTLSTWDGNAESSKGPQRRPTRVLLVAPVGEGVGGILSQTNALVQEWGRDPGLDVRAIDSTQRYRHIHDLRFLSRGLGGCLQAAMIAAQLIAALWKFKPDVVHIRSAGSLGLTRDLVLISLARIAQRKVHLSLHFGRIPELADRGNWEWRLLKLACRTSGHVEVLDRKSAAVLRRSSPHCEVHQFANGVSCAWVDAILRRSCLSKTLGHRLRIVFVGYVLPTKGVVELVQACAEIQDVDFELEIIGPAGPKVERQLRGIAAVRNEGRWLTLSGPVTREKAIEKIGGADVFALPSYTEGFPVSVLEAMACGVAIVASDVGAIPEMLVGEKGKQVGVIVPPRDTELLRLALRNLLTDGGARADLGARARRKCEKDYEIKQVARWWARRWATGCPDLDAYAVSPSS